MNSDLILSRERFALRRLIDRTLLEALGKPELTTYYDIFLEKMVVDLNTAITVEKLQHQIFRDTKSHTIAMATSWWQFFKDQYSDRWWLGWLVKRYPVKYRKVSWTHEFIVHVQPMTLFPKDTHVYPTELGQPTRYVRVETTDRDL